MADVEGAVFIPVPVRRPREQVEEQLRNAILSGQVAINAKLPPETALSKEFGVSRTTIREALRSLSAQGLIAKVPGAGGGSFVRSVDHFSLGLVLREGIENLLQLGTIEISEASAVRTILEVPAAQLAAENRTDSDLVHLQSALDRLAKAPVDDPEIPTLDAEFHTRIALASGNRVLSCLVFALHRASEPVRHLDLTSDTAREGHRQHRALLTAIRDRDAQGAGAAMTTHLSYLRSHPREHVDRGTG
jgi:GntR family transcriptional regulator, transcriptional repressor for pyruvate dehydrogenase complex